MTSEGKVIVLTLLASVAAWWLFFKLIDWLVFQ